MQNVYLDKRGFATPVTPVSSGGMLRYAVDVEENLNGILNGLIAFERQLFQPATEVTISGGVLSAPTLALHTVKAESGTTDDLDTIAASNDTFVVLKAKSGHVISIRHATGDISTRDGSNLALSGQRAALLYCRGGQWAVLGTNHPLNNTSAMSDPGSGDDAADGFSVDSLWINTTLDRAWVCIDATSGAAIWKLIVPWKNGWGYRAAAATVEAIGAPAATVFADGTPSAFLDDTNPYVDLDTLASTGTTAYVHSTSFNLVRPAYSPIVEFYLGTASSNKRVWVGLTSADVTNVDTLAAGTKFIGFRQSDGAGDTGWVPVLNDGTAQTIGTALSPAYPSKLRIRVVPGIGTAYFSVNDGAEQALSSNFPAVETDMGMTAHIWNTGTSVRGIQFARAEVGW